MIPCYAHRIAIYAELVRLAESLFGRRDDSKKGE
jgi:hypothetical protein